MIKRTREYLNNRMITDEIIEKFKLDDGVYYGKFWITIPIYDESGKHVFTKLRKDPTDEKNLSKYKYFPYGVKPALYGADKLDVSKESIYVCEGEFDALVLQSQGLNAVSSTSGSGTFKDEWISILGHFEQVYICYDADEAGQRGAEKIYRKLMAKEHSGDVYNIIPNKNDISDFFMEGNTLETLLSLAKFIQKVNLELGDAEINILDKLEYLRAIIKTMPHDFTSKLCYDMIESEQRRLRKFKYVSSVQNIGEQINIEKIKKTLSIKDITDSKPKQSNQNHDMYLCPIHNEDTPSFAWYKNTNSFYCFGCHQGGSIIDLYMNMHDIKFFDAIKELNKLI